MDEPLWLDRTIIEALHAAQIGEHGGRFGLRDAGLLESGLARPRQVWSYEPETDVAALAAEHGYGLVKNHAFVDGNKRIAFVATNVFLILNGYEISAPEPEVVEVMLRLADDRMTRIAFAEWIRSVLVPYDG